MLITNKIDARSGGGRALLSQLLRKCLEALLGDGLIVCELEREPVSGALSRAQALAGYIDGVSPVVEATVIEAARENGASRILLDGSNLGRIAQAVNRDLPQVEVLTFFHNVEARFFLGAFRTSPRLHALGVLVANYIAERMAVRHSDHVVTLSERDSRGLARLYGRAATDIFPMAMEDKGAEHRGPGGATTGDGYALFVGGAFYANEAGIRWYVENVVPEIGLKTYVVGRGMDGIRAELERSGRVEVIGASERLGDFYSNAKVVIAPIFDGSGMKTKVAEALMFGKKIAGTKEAFSGYEDIAAHAGWVCNTKEEFVHALREAEELPVGAFDPQLRRLYETRYSYEAAQQRLAQILAG